MSEELRNEQKKCPNFELDDWGVCEYQINWEVDACEGNCLIFKHENESISKGEKAFNELTKDEMVTLNELIEGKD